VREHAHTVSDFLAPTLSIECEPCGRRGRYNISKLLENAASAASLAHAQGLGVIFQEVVHSV
jgi:hypothetical protein